MENGFRSGSGSGLGFGVGDAHLLFDERCDAGHVVAQNVDRRSVLCTKYVNPDFEER